MICAALVLMMSCEKSDNTCNCNDPLEDLAWLKELKSSEFFSICTCRMHITQATYNKQTVFYAGMNDPACDGYGAIVLLNCNGDSIKRYEPPILETFTNEVTDRKEIYVCDTKK